MGVFQAGDDPADHNVAEVVDYLKGDVSPEERDRVTEAERGGKNRVGIMSGSGVEAPADEGEAPASLGPDEAKTEAEQEAHAATAAAVEAAQAESAVEAEPGDGYGRTEYDDEGNITAVVYTPDEALKAAVSRSAALAKSNR